MPQDNNGPTDSRPDRGPIARFARGRLALIVGRAQLLRRFVRRGRGADAGRLDAGLAEIEGAAKDLVPVVDHLEGDARG